MENLDTDGYANYVNCFYNRIENLLDGVEEPVRNLGQGDVDV